jgi:hypothetical protein
MWAIVCLLLAAWKLYVGVMIPELEVTDFYNPFKLVSRLALC